MVEVGVPDITTVFKPRATNDAAAEYAGFLVHAAFGTHQVGNRRDGSFWYSHVRESFGLQAYKYGL